MFCFPCSVTDSLIKMSKTLHMFWTLRPDLKQINCEITAWNSFLRYANLALTYFKINIFFAQNVDTVSTTKSFADLDREMLVTMLSEACKRLNETAQSLTS